MNRMKQTCLSLAACLLLLFPMTVSAGSTDKAAEQVDPRASCSLTLHYIYEDTPAGGEEVSLYHLADYDRNFDLTACGTFASYGITLEHMTTQEAWESLQETASAYITADELPPDELGQTDRYGSVEFSDLSPGIYLVRELTVQKGSTTWTFAETLISIPGIEKDGSLNYQVEACPKGSLHQKKPGERQLVVEKKWSDAKHEADRPAEVTVEIYRDRTLYQTVTLSETNSWTYTWKTAADDAVWTVVERKVPAGYTTSMKSTGKTYTITNTYSKTRPPKTGDTSELLLSALVLATSGGLLVALLLLLVRQRRPRHDLQEIPDEEDEKP